MQVPGYAVDITGVPGRRRHTGLLYPIISMTSRGSVVKNPLPM